MPLTTFPTQSAEQFANVRDECSMLCFRDCSDDDLKQMRAGPAKPGTPIELARVAEDVLHERRRRKAAVNRIDPSCLRAFVFNHFPESI